MKKIGILLLGCTLKTFAPGLTYGPDGKVYFCGVEQNSINTAFLDVVSDRINNKEDSIRLSAAIARAERAEEKNEILEKKLEEEKKKAQAEKSAMEKKLAQIVALMQANTQTMMDAMQNIVEKLKKKSSEKTANIHSWLTSTSIESTNDDDLDKADQSTGNS